VRVLDFPFESALQLSSSDFSETLEKVDHLIAAGRPHYPKLLAIKKKYDPTGLFVVHHGGGSEEWNADGFTRLAGP
jgi:hypothetical protein